MSEGNQLTKKEQFACAALTGLLSGEAGMRTIQTEIATKAFEIAEKMVALCDKRSDT